MGGHRPEFNPHRVGVRGNSVVKSKGACPAIETRTTRPIGTKLDLALSKQFLEVIGHELAAPIRLDTLNGKGELLEHSLLDEVYCPHRLMVRVESQDSHPGAVINGGELPESFAYFAAIDLNALTRGFKGREFVRWEVLL
jgi:hypothetical protein